MPEQPFPIGLLERIKNVKNKRAKFVLDHIVANGQVTTEELKNAGYDHPPRARMDAVDLGFGIKSIKAKRADGGTIAAYVFEEGELDPNKTGRVVMAKKERETMIKEAGSRCNCCGGKTNFQVDHRVPYQVVGESQKDAPEPYQILDGVCNRRKSWACEHCPNLLQYKKFETCLTCYWANPECYTHVSMQPERRIDLVWIGDEVQAFDTLKAEAKRKGTSMPDEIKATMKSAVMPKP